MQDENQDLNFLKKHRGEEMQRANTETDSEELKAWRRKQHDRVSSDQASIGKTNGAKGGNV